MPIRDFVDADGVRWNVWSTVPEMRGVVGSMQGGWLTFESGEVRRRLVPIPANWHGASLGELRELCRKAEPVRASTRTGSRRAETRDSRESNESRDQ